VETRQDGIAGRPHLYRGTTGVQQGCYADPCNISSVVQQFSAMVSRSKRPIPEPYGDLSHVPFSRVLGKPEPSSGTAGCCTLVPKPEAGVIVDMLEKFRPTFLPGVPTIYTALLGNEKIQEDGSFICEGVFGGAAPLPGKHPERVKKNPRHNNL